MKKILLTLATLTLLAGCADGDVDYNLPQDREDTWKNSQGKLTGENGLVVFGGSDDSAAAAASPIGVNSYLWRATLDTLSFMPLVSADPFGGVIITDWYEDPAAKGERFKVNALILDRTLRADGVRVTLFKQTKTRSGGWEDNKVDSSVSRTLEDTILTRARELRVDGK